MSDIPCAVCGEPWEGYGVFHGDMKPWEQKLFCQGAGCPSCDGEPLDKLEQENATLAQFKAVAFGAWDDPTAFAVYNSGGVLDKVPEWKRPEDEVIFTCHGCNAEILKNSDSYRIEYNQYSSGRFNVTGLYWRGGRFREMYNHSDEWDIILSDCIEVKGYFDNQSGAYGSAVETPPAKWLVEGEFYCPGCADRCGDCDKYCLLDDLTLPEGKIQNGDAICSDCYDEKYDACRTCDTEVEKDELDEEGNGPCCPSSLEEESSEEEESE